VAINKKMNIVLGSKGTEKTKQKIGGVERSIKSMVLAVGGATTGFYALQKGITFAVSTAARFQDLRTRLQNMYGTVRDGNRAFEKFNEIAAKTPYQLDQVVEAGAQLKAFGMDAENTLGLAADLAAFMGTDIVSAANAMGRAFAGGAGAADIFRERGILNLISMKSGIQDLTKLTKGEFREVMIKTLSDPSTGIVGATQKMAENFNGAVSNMKDAATRRAAEIGESMLPMLTSLVKKTTEWLSVPVSQKLRSEQVEFNSLIEILKDANSLQDTRNRAIKELQDKYGDYIGNIKLEKARLEDLNKVQDAANEKFLERIRLKAIEEKMAEFESKRVKILTSLFEWQKKNYELGVKLAEQRKNEAKMNRNEREALGFLIGKYNETNIRIKQRKDEIAKLNEDQKEYIQFLNQEGISLSDLIKKEEKDIGNKNKKIEQNKTLIEQTAKQIELAEKMRGVGFKAEFEFAEQAIGLTEMTETEKERIRSEFRDRYIQAIEGDYALEKKNIERQVALYRKAGVDEVLIRKWVNKQIQNLNIARAQSFAGMIASTMSLLYKSGDVSVNVARRAAQISALVNAYAAANKALAAYPPPFSFIAMAAALAAGLANVKIIESQKFSEGGIVKGAGVGDSVPAALTPGEVVLNLAQQENLLRNAGGVTINIQGDFVGTEENADRLAEIIAERSQLGFNRIAVAG
jgi:hypothetical protein